MESSMVSAPAAQKGRTKKKKRGTGKKILIAVIILLVAALCVFVYKSRNPAAAETAVEYTNYTVERRDITVTLSGTGTLEPADSYSVVSTVGGEILTSDFEEGDTIKKGTILYTIDPKTANQNIKTAQDSLESAQLQLEKAQRNYNELVADKAKHDEQRAKDISDLSLYSKLSGQISALYVESGDTISAGTVIADVLDAATMTVTLPFLQDEAVRIKEGDSAEVMLSLTGETLYGIVAGVSAVNQTNAYGVPVRDVTINVQNPGALTENASVTAEIGSFACNDEGMLAYKTKDTIKALKSGEIESLNVEEGDWIGEGQLVLKLVETEDNSNYDSQINSALDSIREAEKSVESRNTNLDQAIEALEDYEITSPIDGTVIEKNYKAGDTLSSTSQSQGALSIIYDLSSLNFVLNVDELDISNIEVGQKATITSDAIEGKAFTGEVIRKSVKGTTSSGVTTYPVTIRITETEGLLPGMNINAEIMITNKQNVIAIPNSALMRGNNVLAKKGMDSASGVPEAAREGRPQGEEPEGMRPEGESRGANRNEGMPEGFEMVKVVPGDTDGTFIEIVSGLEEGDVISYIAVDLNALGSNFNGANGMYFAQQGGGPGSGPSGGNVVRSEVRIGG